MRSEETVYPNDTTRAIRTLIERTRDWGTGNGMADQRHLAMVLTKLEEAELLSLRMVREDGES